jgi:uncharacterized membrane protein YhaH (DUF805 family)
MHWMLLPLRRFADFRGRSRRMEYWMFGLFLVIGSMVAAALDSGLGLGRTVTVVDSAPGFWSQAMYTETGWITRIFVLAMLIPSLAVSIRRLHDIGRSGFWLLIGLVPLAGGIVLLVFFLTGSQRGANRWGPDPMEPVAAPVSLG